MLLALHAKSEEEKETLKRMRDKENNRQWNVGANGGKECLLRECKNLLSQLQLK